MLRVLIVGNTSMVGKRLIYRLKNVCELITAGNDKNADIYLDLSSSQIDSFNFPDKVDVIVYCSASFGGNSIDEMINNEIINSLGTLLIGRLALDTSCKHIIYLSTISVFNHPENQYFNSYGLSKKHGQENLEYFCSQMNIGYTALLLTQLYDEWGEARRHQPLFYHMLEQARMGFDINIYGKNDVNRNYLFVEDVAEIIARIIKKRLFGIFPCIHPNSYPISKIAQMMLEVFARGGRINFLHDKPDIPTVYIPKDLSIYSLINYYPQVDLSEGIMKIKQNMYK